MKTEIPKGAMVAVIAVVVIVVVFFGYRVMFPHRDAGPSPEDMRKHMSGQSGTYGMPGGGGGSKMGSYPSSTGSPMRGGAGMSGGYSSSGGYPSSGGAPTSGGQ